MLTKNRNTTQNNTGNIASSMLTGNIVKDLATLSTGLDSVLVPIENLVEAPIEWNFYGRLNANKMAELIESINSIGMQHPIVVWEQSDGNYMILSGHNRKRAYEILRTLESKDSNKYKQIHAVVRKKDEITEDMAKQIIIDTNWVQRELTPLQKAKSICMKYQQIKETSKKKININMVIAEEYNITDRQILEYKSLMKLIPAGQNLVEHGHLSIKAGVKLSRFSESIQQHLISNFDSDIINKKHSLLQPNYTIQEIEEILNRNDTTKIFIKLPEDKKTEFLYELSLLKEKYQLIYKKS